MFSNDINRLIINLNINIFLKCYVHLKCVSVDRRISKIHDICVLSTSMSHRQECDIGNRKKSFLKCCYILFENLNILL